MDIKTTKPDGGNWDFTTRSDRRGALELVDKVNTDFVVGSLPCTPFCSWNVNMSIPNMCKEDVDNIVAEAKQTPEIYGKEISQTDGSRQILYP